ncbi:MAG: hypothetical protein SNJ78_12935, partial [Spirochaetales bacterium]
MGKPSVVGVSVFILEEGMRVSKCFILSGLWVGFMLGLGTSPEATRADSFSLGARVGFLNTSTSGVSRQDLLVHMELASREKSFEKWISLSDCIDSVTPEWEQESLYRLLFDRFRKFLLSEWDTRIPKVFLQDLLTEIDVSNRLFLLQTDEEGRFVLDEVGDPILKGIEEFAKDEADWKNKVEETKLALLNQWEQEAKVKYQELLSSFSGVGEELLQQAAQELTVTIGEYKKGLEQEMERLIQRSSKQFLQARLRDSFSLRKKREKSTAEALAVSLWSDTEAQLNEGIKRLESALPPTTEEPVIRGMDPSHWQEEFKREFEQGIASWKRVEETFLQERLLWESQTQKGYLAAEESWDNLFQEFSVKKNQWIKEMESLLAQGREQWEEEQGSFLKSKW